MQIVIEIPNGYDLSQIKNGSIASKIILDAAKSGTPLPKGHGKIKDIDKIEWYGCTTEFECPHKDRECKNCNKAKCSKTQVDAIPTIIEADKGDKE